VLDNRGKVIAASLAEHDAIDPFAAEVKEVIKAVRTGHPSPILGGDLARDAIMLAHKQTESVLHRKRVKI
jgi:hypothetical protein